MNGLAASPLQWYSFPIGLRGRWGNTQPSMLSISFIIFFSVVLFVYWFRYSCLLILQDRASHSLPLAVGAGLTFPAVQQRLREGERGLEILDQLQRDLANDYRIVCFLLRCTPETSVDPIERRMLMLDY